MHRALERRERLRCRALNLANLLRLEQVEPAEHGLPDVFERRLHGLTESGQAPDRLTGEIGQPARERTESLGDETGDLRRGSEQAAGDLVRARANLSRQLAGGRTDRRRRLAPDAACRFALGAALLVAAVPAARPGREPVDIGHLSGDLGLRPRCLGGAGAPDRTRLSQPLREHLRPLGRRLGRRLPSFARGGRLHRLHLVLDRRGRPGLPGGSLGVDGRAPRPDVAADRRELRVLVGADCRLPRLDV